MIDLHTHSTCSDGSESPGRLAELAALAGLSAFALTDHDNLSGIREAASAAAGAGIGFVPGCEVSCRFAPGTMHLLCYFVEPGEGPLQALLVRLFEDRERRNERLVERLSDLGIDITMDEVVAEAGGGAIGRPHFAAVLSRKGAVASYEEAFETLLQKGGPAYVPKASLSPEEVIAAAAGSGALTVLAHPLTLGLEPAGLGRTLSELAAAGLSGLECAYSRYSPGVRAELGYLASTNGLVATGGSDFHGSYKPDIAIGTGTGDLVIEDSVLERLRDRL